MVRSEEYILLVIKNVLSLIQDIINLSEELKFTNKQWYLDFEDELNKFSIKDHGPLA